MQKKLPPNKIQDLTNPSNIIVAKVPESFFQQITSTKESDLPIAYLNIYPDNTARIITSTNQSYSCHVRAENEASLNERIITEGYNSKYELRGKINTKLLLANDGNYHQVVKEYYENDKHNAKETVPKDFDHFKTIKSMNFIMHEDHMSITTDGRKEDMRPPKEYREKRVRKPEEEVREMLFNIFSKNPRYQIKGLVELTDQPENYLKEILNQICIKHTKGEFNGYYELKPFYQSTKQSAGK
jgi:transcription initiation factor TFIIF subunit beta